MGIDKLSKLNYNKVSGHQAGDDYFYFKGGNHMYEYKHSVQSRGDTPRYRYVDIYVKDMAEALEIETGHLTQGSKLYIVETAELYVLNENAGVWCSAVDGRKLGQGGS